LKFPRTIPELIPESCENPARIPEWTKPLSSTEIAEILASFCGDGGDERAVKTFQRNICNWYKAVREAYCWLPETNLRIGNGKNTRYTSFCCQQFETLAQVGKDGYDLWIASVHAANPDKLNAPAPSSMDQAPPQPQVNNAMVPYQPLKGEMERFTPPERKIRKFVSTEEFTKIAKQNTETALDVTQSNSTSLTDALINQMEQEGQKLGLTLFQAKYGTAHSIMAGLEEALAKKSGLETESVPGSPPD
jgi:hypothetical protein